MSQANTGRLHNSALYTHAEAPVSNTSDYSVEVLYWSFPLCNSDIETGPELAKIKRRPSAQADLPRLVGITLCTEWLLV